MKELTIRERRLLGDEDAGVPEELKDLEDYPPKKKKDKDEDTVRFSGHLEISND